MSEKDASITFRLPSAEKELLQKKLSMLGISKSDFFRDAISRFLSEPTEQRKQKSLREEIYILEQQRAILIREWWKAREKEVEYEGELRLLNRDGVSKDSLEYQSWLKREKYYEHVRLETWNKRKEIETRFAQLASKYLETLSDAEIKENLEALNITL